jgi:hypothetical protein
MTKNNVVKKHKEVLDDFDFSEIMEPSYDDTVIADVMSGLIEASNNQMKLLKI